MEFLKTNLDWGVMGLLGAMSFLMITFVIERFFFYARIDLDSFDDLEDLDLALTRHLTTIATIGANAPYIGLLGTVLGLLIAFHDMGVGGAIETSTMMIGLALALKATALGLLVAIPSLVFYNALLRRTDQIKARWRRERRQ